MKSDLLSRHTYARWVGYGTLFGITRNSFMILASSSFLVLDHLKNMYYRMVSLCLAQRASILRFSDETAGVAAMKEPGDTFQAVQQLQEKYLGFVNRFYFREVTAQEQGIELYHHIQEAMNIERDVKDLNAEIDHLHQYVSIQKDRKTNRVLNLLSVLGALFVIPAFITGFFGMNVFSEKVDITQPLNFTIVFGAILLMAILGFLFVRCRNKSKSDKYSFWDYFLLVSIGVIMIALLSLPLWSCVLPGID
jgi:hypothetical protein